jgi:predicted nucleotidyltransferase
VSKGLDLVDESLRALGTTRVDLLEDASAIVLFGSRAARLERSGSDWDILCIGRGRTRHTRLVDLVWVPEERADTKAWLGSELGHHVGTYGVWLAGSSAWRGATYVSGAAIDRKIEIIRRDAEVLVAKWDVLADVYQRKHARLLSRDMLRLSHLLEGIAVPPTPRLDAVGMDAVTLRRIARDTGLSRYDTFFDLLLERIRVGTESD